MSSNSNNDKEEYQLVQVPVGGKVTLEGNLSIPKNASWTKVEVLIAYSQTKKIIGDILNVIFTHSASDGKIFVYNVEEAYDIGTKKTGDISLQGSFKII